MPKIREPFLQLGGKNQFLSAELLELIEVTLGQRIRRIICIASVPIDAGRASKSDCQDNDAREPKHALMIACSRLKGTHRPNEKEMLASSQFSIVAAISHPAL
jgi:hypothetical protein